MLGVELVTSRESKEPNAEATMRLVEDARDKGVLLGRTGRHGNVVRLKPPMCITEQDVDFTLAVIEEALRSRA